jgi:hypothetical protein
MDGLGGSPGLHKKVAKTEEASNGCGFINSYKGVERHLSHMVRHERAPTRQIVI